MQKCACWHPSAPKETRFILLIIRHNVTICTSCILIVKCLFEWSLQFGLQHPYSVGQQLCALWLYGCPVKYEPWSKEKQTCNTCRQGRLNIVHVTWMLPISSLVLLGMCSSWITMIRFLSSNHSRRAFLSSSLLFYNEHVLFYSCGSVLQLLVIAVNIVVGFLGQHCDRKYHLRRGKYKQEDIKRSF